MGSTCRINAVCPGIIDTAMMGRFTGATTQGRNSVIEQEPIGRMGTPEEIAEAVLWLCSGSASFATGHALFVDGGQIKGEVYIDAVAAPAGSSTFGAAAVHFAPGARTAWHTHPHGQTIFVTEGLGLCQREGGPVEAIRPGERVFFEPDENHWHGATPSRFMIHIAMQQNDASGNPVTWGRHVTDDEYETSPTNGD